MYKKARFLPAGDKALVVEFGNEINPHINRMVRNLYLAVKKNKLEGIGELVPTYRSLLVYYDPIKISLQELEEHLRKLEISMADLEIPEPKITLLPVVYGGQYGPDLGDVAGKNKLTQEEVVRIHTQADYLIYMLGFTPGFTYLGGMSQRIATPRLRVPRTCIPAGSVGIADKQTGVYPIDSPGGWRIIGRTPVKLYDPYSEPPVVLFPGDYVRFVAIGEEDYVKIKEGIERGTFRLQVLAEKPRGGE
ncbi:MAG: 5-oxoprolinase subunit PxpB [Peptococcaceae bacterium]|nr:5-oxoprolinase subunit PxpB [Peptococcaceae bacterium]